MAGRSTEIGSRAVGSLAVWMAVGVALLLPASAGALTVAGDGSNATVVSPPGESTSVNFIHEKNVTLASPTPPFLTTVPSAWVVSAFVLPPGGNGAGTQAQASTTPPCTHFNPVPTSPAVCPGEGTITFELGDEIDHFAGMAARPEHQLPSNVIANGGSGEDVVYGAALGGTWELDGGPDDDAMGLNAVAVQSGGAFVKEALPGTYVLNGGEGDDKILTSNFLGPDGSPPAIGSDAIAIQADGGPGNDLIALIETKGDDHLAGGEGDDDFQDGAGDDTVEGGPGDDQLHGEAGRDAFSGGPGNDEIVSSEVGIESATKAAGAEPDTVECGTGADTVYADQADTVAADCDELGDVIQSCTEAGGCQVAVTIEAPPAAEAGASASAAARRRHKARPVVLGRGSFHLGKGKKKLAAARLLKSGQKLIKKKKRLKATIVVRVTSGHGKHKKVKSHRGKVLLVSGHKK